MSFISIIFIGFAMSTDAFAAAIGKGIALRKPSIFTALKIGVIFGVIEAITPVIGWLIGQTATSFVEEWDHWIALVLLSALGLHMIHNGLTGHADGEESEDDKPKVGIVRLALTGLATSIDAMAVGVGLAFLNVNIYLVAAVIGFCTFLMVTIGVMLGRVLGQKVGDKAEIVGGLILIFVGVMIAVEHLG
ncbi:manganese efflux pump MntP family protein [Methylophaga sp. OBS3]|uniref:manganese efflux pump MntP n=1 Tax=Methylophaga sp. OBS3 TaxID=2991934 RepID=UPI002256783D|nr:manganese efflux pump MntP family protein [Methylophaga sp. OBS3]MCX4188976.1 manganese efflux pump MntP family protein [Methylophaga sp. OBS3]